MSEEVNAKIWFAYQIYSVLIVLFQCPHVSRNIQVIPISLREESHLWWRLSLVVAVKGSSFGPELLGSPLKALDLSSWFLYLCNPWIHWTVPRGIWDHCSFIIHLLCNLVKSLRLKDENLRALPLPTPFSFPFYIYKNGNGNSMLLFGYLLAMLPSLWFILQGKEIIFKKITYLPRSKLDSNVMLTLTCMSYKLTRRVVLRTN